MPIATTTGPIGGAGRERARSSEQDERSGPRRAEAFRRTTVPAPKIDAVDAIANRHVSVRVGKITGA